MAQNDKDFETLKQEYNSAIERSFPKTAIGICDQIIAKAEQENKYGWFLWGWFKRSECIAKIAPDSLYSQINELELLCKREKQPVNKMIMHSMLAYSYNRVGNSRRRVTDVARGVSEDSSSFSQDMSAWSSKQFKEVTLKHLESSLSDPQKLLNSNTYSYYPFIVSNDSEFKRGERDISSFFNHDLLHIIYFKNYSILNSLCNSTDQEEEELKNELVKKVCSTYKDNGNYKALLYLKYNEIYLSSMGNEGKYLEYKNLYESTPDSFELKGEILFRMAEVKYGYDNIKSLELCNLYLDKYPDDVASSSVKQLKAIILKPQVDLQIPSLLSLGDSVELFIRHKNSKGITVQRAKVTNTKDIKIIKGSQYTTDEKEKILKRITDWESFHIDLTPPQDYKISECKRVLNATDGCGIYVYRFIVDEEPSKIRYSNTDFQFVTSIVLVTERNLNCKENRIDLFVLDRVSGNPIKGADIVIYRESYGNNGNIVLKEKSDSNGRVILRNSLAEKDRYYYIEALIKDDEACPIEVFFNGLNYSTQKYGEQIVVNLFTDRGLYRPGQTLFFKGLVYSQVKDEINVANGRTFKVTLIDPNYQEISSEEFKTNEFGSFNGSFIIPQKVFNGTFIIKAETLDRGGKGKVDCFFKVEEYKRPSFEVEFNEYALPYSLGDTITLTGKVKTFSGVAVADAEVKVSAETYSLRSAVENPEKDQVIFTRTDKEGNFSADIVLKGGSQYRHLFIINADVTSQNGETQGTKMILYAGKSSYIIQLENATVCKDEPVENIFKLLNNEGSTIQKTICYVLKNTKGTMIEEGEVAANEKVSFDNWRALPSGKYNITANVKGVPKEDCEFNSEILLFSYKDAKPIENTPLWFMKKEDKLYYGTSFTNATMFLSIATANEVITSENIKISNEIKTLDVSYKPKYNDGALVTLFIFREGRLYFNTLNIEKPKPEKKLNLKWGVFRDKLYAGQDEKWSLSVTDMKGKAVESEVLALMYDLSLDKIYSNHNLVTNFGLYFSRSIPFSSLSYRENLNYPISTKGMRIRGVASLSSSMEKKYQASVNNDYFISADDLSTNYDYPEVVPRSNFAETAFFYPTLRTDERGEVSIEFTLPESLTRWKFMALAHTKEFDYGSIQEEVVAQKEFMLSPNMPRFLRKGDKTNIASVISNLTSDNVSADVKIELFDPITEKIYSSDSKKISVDSQQSEVVDFILPSYPDSIELLGVRIVARSDRFSDGEQHLLSVLPNTTRVVESVPLTIAGNQTKTFSLEKLFNNGSNSATNKALTIEYAGNPAWYAVMAIPTLSEPQSDNVVSWASSLYVNSLSSRIAEQNPKIKNVIEAWKRSADSDNINVLQSKLSQNEELKNVIVDETPWVMEAKDQASQMENISKIFDNNALQFQTHKALTKLKEFQQSDGGWPWFKGMTSSRYITEYVLTLFARLNSDLSPMQRKGIDYLGNCAKKEYETIQRYLKENPKAKDEGISYAALRYLYILAISNPNKTFNQMIELEVIDPSYREAFNYFLKKVNELPNSWDIQEKSMVAIVLKSAQRYKEAKEVIQSIREHLTQSENKGMFFDFIERPWSWGRHKVNAQTAAIEAINIVDPDVETIEQMKLWLLNQKRTQDWESTTATVDAIYSLLMTGNNLLDSKGDMTVDLIEKNKKVNEISGAVPALNYVKQQFTDEQSVNTKSITVSKNDSGIAWGALYATFQEKISNLQELGNEELSITKELYVKRSVPFGNGYKDELQLITKDNGVKVGDVVTARMIIKVGRDLEFVHLKDQRAVCFEPMSQLSGYRFGGGTWFYLEIKDAATNLFFEKLSKGEYVLELNYRVSRRGEYEAGFATIQCTYAPEFSAHSAATAIVVK